MNYEQYAAYGHEQLNAFLKSERVDYTPEMFEHIKLNNHRSARVYQTQSLDDSLVAAVKAICSSQKWLLITEPWCGDAAHSVPIIARLASLNSLISLEIFLRDRNPELMDQYLTDGSRSIPILIIRDVHGNDLGKWGPRPNQAQKMVKELKSRPEVSKKEAMELVQLWYARNKYLDIQEELLNLINKIVHP